MEVSIFYQKYFKLPFEFPMFLRWVKTSSESIFRTLNCDLKSILELRIGKQSDLFIERFSFEHSQFDKKRI